MKKIILSISLLTVLSACGGGGSSSGGSSDTDDALQRFSIRQIQFELRDENYQPNQAEIDCVSAIEQATRQQVLDCVNNN